MTHNCFISFKKEDVKFKNLIIDKLGKERILGKALDYWIDSEDIDYIMQKIRNELMVGTTVTLFLIGEHSSENEGCDAMGDKNIFIKRELQATLYDQKGTITRQGYRRSGLLGIVLPSMYNKVYCNREFCNICNNYHDILNINDDTVIREFSANYWLYKDKECCYTDKGRFCVLVKFDDFIREPDVYIDLAYDKINQPIADLVHFRDLRK